MTDQNEEEKKVADEGQTGEATATENAGDEKVAEQGEQGTGEAASEEKQGE